jgi:hypothetical protein
VADTGSFPFFTGNSALSHVPWNIQMRDTIRRSCFVRVATQSPWTKEVRCWVCFPIRTTRVTRSICAGDVLVLYTDGAVEAENQAGEQYSATRLANIASMYSQQSADELVETIYRSITEFRGTKLLADDLTLVVLKTC